MSRELEAKIPYESRIVRQFRRIHERDQMEQMAERITRETGDEMPDTSVTPGMIPGDAARLRGIPVVGVPGGFGGAINGSTPDGWIRLT